MFRTENLAFDVRGLEPLMSEETIGLHHGVHYAGYLKAVNEAVLGLPLETQSLADIIEYARLHERPRLYRNAGQAWNHGFFFASVTDIRALAPQDTLADAIAAQYGALDALQAEFVARSTKHFASGWLWLTADRTGEIGIETTQDADPIWITSETTPLLVCDLWEHAYYLDWRNDRTGFVKEFISERADWRLASLQYDAALRGDVGWRHP
jgi:Fe-Mn family superoxide dismutase